MYSIDYSYLRPKKADALKKWHETDFPNISSLRVQREPHATILPLRKVDGDSLLFGRGGVVDQNNNYVPLSALDDRVQSAYDFTISEYVDQKVVFCGYLINHWGHFLVESVTRLWYFLEKDPSVDKYVFFIEENSEREVQGNFRAFLELLTIWDKVEIINKPTQYREVVIPELSLKLRGYYSPKYIDVFDTVANNITVDPSWCKYKKIYFSRSQLAKNRFFEFGFEALDNFFSRNDYKILFPEKLPLAEMIYYIRHAEVVATVSGTLPHNMLFANQNQTLQIVERCVVNNDYQVHINIMKNLHTVYIDANMPVYTVSMAGPFIMGYNDILERFANDQGYIPPSPKFLTEKYKRTCFAKYMRTYIDMYQYHWYMDDWYIPFTDYLLEASEAGKQYFNDYLAMHKPFLWHHYFEFHYWKQFIKRILKRFR